jgi:hypothetical protein
MKTSNVPRESFKPKYVPRNVAGVPSLPKEIHRVVVLPTYWGADPKADFVCDLDTILQLSLQRTGSFEVVPIDREMLFKLFHEYQFSSVSILPDNLLPVIAEKYAAEAVMFVDLTQNRPYRPIALGIRAKLVDTKSARILWAVDCLFDSADPAVAKAAVDFSDRGTYTARHVESTGSILLSPRAFASFVADSMFGTLPVR